jgi:hypothetical protein
MSLALGQPMFINQKEVTVTAPLDCETPVDYLRRVPVARSDSEQPSPIAERLARIEMSNRFCEVKELAAEGPIPRNPEKVKELHQFAIEFRKNLPGFFQTTNPDTKWDKICPFIPIHRELLAYMADAFSMLLHRTYIFTREKCQRQVYDSSLSILDSQDRLFAFARNSQSSFYISLTFPTFDAAVLLAVVLVSNPERYHKNFERPYQSLKRALERLEFIGAVFPLAKTGADILHTALRRVVEAQHHAGFPPNVEKMPIPDDSGTSTSTSLSPDSNLWQFGASPAMNWITQNPDFSDFDFSNLEVPMPLKELLLDEEWMAGVSRQTHDYQEVEQPMMYTADNSLWNFLAGYPPTHADQYMQ